MIRQTLAILVDAYRDLNARKLFWITLILSALIVVAFSLVGVHGNAITIAGYHIDARSPVFIYKSIFSQVVIGAWLTWAATVLALVSTAGIFPDFISGGSIDLYLAKPIGRLRLFLTKYFSGLLFVALQVLIVAVGSYLAMGIRIGQWKPSIFWAIPIVLCFFSYLFSICVLLGVSTRSTIAALLLTIVCWMLLALVDRVAEPSLLMFQKVYEYQADQDRQQADSNEAFLRRAEADPKAAKLLDGARERAQTSRQDADKSAHTARVLQNVHRGIYALKTITPKTTDTINLLDRFIFTKAELNGFSQNQQSPGPDQAAMVAGAREMAQELRSRSTAWIVGTSLGFEVVLVAGAAWVFCRRDY